MRAREARDGATPMTPMKAPAGIRTPGRSGDTAAAPSIVHLTRKGVGKKSRRKPKPGMIVVNPNGWGVMSTMCTSRRSPGSAPLTNTGPVRGWTRLRSTRSRSAPVVASVTAPSSASRVSSTTVSPGSTRSTGEMSGCQRLCPVWGSSCRRLLRSMRIACVAMATSFLQSVAGRGAYALRQRVSTVWAVVPAS